MTSKVIQSKLPCPSCPSSDAFHRYDDGHGYCFSCEYYEHGLEDTMEYTYEYLPTRGLTKSTLEHFNCKSKVSSDGRPFEIGFPYPNGSTKVRSLDKKEFKWVGSSEAGLFGLDRFAAGAAKSCIITEGEFDAASFYQVTHIPSYSVRSSSSAVSDVSSVRSTLNDYERVYLAFDNDPRGREATAAVARLFDPSKVYHIKFTNRKDANEYLVAGEGDVLLNLWHNARRWVPDTIVHSFEDFRSILSTPPRLGISYPFPTLTKMTYGIRTGETVLIKAPEKVGKTAIMHAIEHHILKRTQDNVASIFLEEPHLRHLQSLAGLELRRPVHLPDCGVTTAEMVSALHALLGSDERLHLYSHFGVSDPDVLLDTIRFLVVARGCRYVLFDHITMACSGLSSEADERRTLEYLATRLEMQVKELDYALIMVSHVNDFGQTRGSHYLTKVADITIDAARNTQAADEFDRRCISLSVPYNRFCSDTGPAGTIVFDPGTYTLTEEPDHGRHSDHQAE